MPEFSLAGLIVGILVKLTGMGGGALLTPLLTLVLGVPPAWAVGTNIAHLAIIMAISIRGHWKRKQINFSIVGWLACGSLPATFFTALLIGQSSKGNSEQNGIIKHTVGVMLLIASVLLVLKPLILRRLENKQKIGDKQFILSHSWQKRLAMVLTGAVVGTTVALSSIGGGTLILIMLAFLYPRIENKMLVGTTTAQAFVLLLAGSSGYMVTGVGIDWEIMLWLLLGSLPGVWLGSRLSGKLPERWLTWSLVAVLAASGIALLSR